MDDLRAESARCASSKEGEIARSHSIGQQHIRDDSKPTVMDVSP